jgi:hypothetical protein
MSFKMTMDAPKVAVLLCTKILVTHLVLFASYKILSYTVAQSLYEKIVNKAVEEADVAVEEVVAEGADVVVEEADVVVEEAGTNSAVEEKDANFLSTTYHMIPIGVT